MKNQITFSQALEGYLLYADASRLSPHTIADYTNTFRKFQDFLSDDPPINEITVDQVRRFMAAQDHISKKTLLNYHTGLSALWTWATEEEVVEHHIIKRVPRPDPEKPAIKPYTRDDVEAMLAACKSTRPYDFAGTTTCSRGRPTALRDTAIILVLVDTGVRASELCRITIEDVDKRNKRIFIWGKGAKERIVYIAASTSRAIWRYLTTRPEARPDDPLFVTQEGHQLRRDTLCHLIIRIGRRAGIPHANAHRFRHTFAINFLRNGGNAYTLQRLLGHSTLDMVRTYLALAVQDDSDNHRHASPIANWQL
jgi:integrase/recombinase XerD